MQRFHGRFTAYASDREARALTTGSDECIIVDLYAGVSIEENLEKCYKNQQIRSLVYKLPLYDGMLPLFRRFALLSCFHFTASEMRSDIPLLDSAKDLSFPPPPPAPSSSDTPESSNSAPSGSPSNSAETSNKDTDPLDDWPTEFSSDEAEDEEKTNRRPLGIPPLMPLPLGGGAARTVRFGGSLMPPLVLEAANAREVSHAAREAGSAATKEATAKSAATNAAATKAATKAVAGVAAAAVRARRTLNTSSPAAQQEKNNEDNSKS
ncbi:hypothetical protein EAH_00038920 [Eimeria acervulina]|uniref:Uncharacterized protein n=1 Tax=Eimeria acervulina TaxID=5801 RepID=U6GFE5_EIMAC|nr:hypothetical protein EAH_00038920 [Eimeria acervulina]CDI78981.1 hypothetical protein EAH_00038920 [Eimeria acervulina]